jgi:purine nucleosidase
MEIKKPKQKWIVDTDPGCDDMMAILYLLSRPDVEVLMFSLVDGNVSLDHVTINSRKILKIAGKKIPLYRGSSNPILRTCSNADSYHYCDGLGDIEEIRTYDYNDIQVEKENSLVKICEFVEKYPGEINFLCLAPLTSIAGAFMLNPNLPKMIKKIYMMGGSILSLGNHTPNTEFNFAYDFIATKIVLTHFKNIVITPWEPTANIYVKDHHLKTFSDNIISRKQLVNDLLFHYISLIIAKFTKEKHGIQLCDLYSVIPAFNLNSVKKYSLCKCESIIDSGSMVGMLYIKSRKVIESDFQTFMKDFQRYTDDGYHVIVEEMSDLVILEEYEQVFLKLEEKIEK